MHQHEEQSTQNRTKQNKTRKENSNVIELVWITL